MKATVTKKQQMGYIFGDRQFTNNEYTIYTPDDFHLNTY